MDTYVSTNLTVDFKINRIVEKRLVCSHYDLILELEIDPEYTATEQTKRLSNLKYWVDYILNNCIAFNVYTKLSTDILGEIDNYVMFCPEEPNDYLILLLVVAKLNAIGSGVVTITHASLGSDTNQGFGNALVGDPLDMLPTAENWMGAIRYFDQAWWNRPDGGMMDMAVEEGADVNIKPDILVEIDPSIVKIETNSSIISDADLNEEKPGAEIIKLNFKPRLIVDNTDNDDQS
jgi:hypothetical protein